MTLRPRFYDKEIYMLQTEYRQENKNSSFIADFGYLRINQTQKIMTKILNAFFLNLQKI